MSLKILPLFLFLLTVACEVRSQANLSVQGSIQNSSGIALADGKYSVVFRLYESESGGTPVWSETHPELEVSGGLYSAALGLITPLTASFDKPYFLGVSVGDSPELYPRARLSSSPYALSLVGQSNLFPSTGTIGVGTKTPDPGSQLHVKNNDGAANIVVEGSEGAEIAFKKGTDTATISYDGDKITISNFNLVFGEGIKLPAGKTIKYNGIADWRLVDTDDFETDNDGWVCHTAWYNTTSGTIERKSSNTPFAKGYRLRPTSGGIACLKKEIDLTGIPHSMVKVVFTYHMFDTWGYYVGGEYEFGFAAFANQPAPYTGPGQSSGIFQIGWRKISTHNFFLFPAGYDDTAGWADGASRGTMVAQTTADKFWVLIGSNLNEASSNESFGISDVEIWVK